MKKYYIYAAFMFFAAFASCKTEDYEWENWTYTAVPIVQVNTAKSALPTQQTGNVSFFNLKDPNVANQEFEFTLDWEGFDRVEVSSIEVYVNYTAHTGTAPLYPIAISSPGNQYPSQSQFPLPSTVGTSDKLYETVTTFPKTYTLTAGQLAQITGTNLSTVKANDYFLFKFILNLSDGRRIVGFQDNVCDESRGEPGDCRVGVRFKNQ